LVSTEQPTVQRSARTSFESFKAATMKKHFVAIGHRPEIQPMRSFSPLEIVTDVESAANG
jgi:hypothetical protein